MSSQTQIVGFDLAQARVHALCDHFDAQRAHVMGAAYKEAEARDEFITPFFEALGWDVRNTAHKSVYEKDVVIESRQNISGTAKSADYAFRRPGTHLTSFFVEAKKPSVDIRGHAECYQAVLYGWNASTPLVVLTDFEQLLILDARSEPDRANAARHILKANGSYTYRDYRDPEKFAELWGLLARENVAAGSLDKAAAALPRLSGRIKKDDLFARGTGPVDETFLAQMELWREKLAKSLKRTNHDLDGERLTSLTQRILDRLVFLRFLEDRGVERDVTFQLIGQSGSAWRDFLKVSRRLDARYNGIIYKKDEHGCEDKNLVVDDPTFAGIAEKFAPENSSYLFDKISITILGSIYERFLGNVIVARDKTAIVEPKPEVRKAGGVYYTPDYIVRYIVEQTVGRCIAEKSPKEIEKLRFADIACGSGSFLVEVFASLIRYHLAWYLADGAPKWEKRGILRTREIDGDYVLTLAEKRRILLANVYGVDLDPQAVAVTQLSLYLRLMEDESFPSTQLLFDEEHRALLPDLHERIICGNSLIEADVADLFGLSAAEEERIRPLTFRWTFPTVFKGVAGGFDAIVGNPPYIRIQALREIIPLTPDYCREHYSAAGKGNYDVYVVFLQRALNLANAGGRVGYIVPLKFQASEYGENLRRLLTAGGHVEHLVNFGAEQVFGHVTTYTCLLFLTKERRNTFSFVDSGTIVDWRRGEPAKQATLSTGSIDALPWSFGIGESGKLITKLKHKFPQLGTVANIFVGLQTSADDVFVLRCIETGAQTSRLFSESLKREVVLENELIRFLVSGTDVHGYAPLGSRQVVIFPYVVTEEGSDIIPLEKLRESYPKTAAYLLQNRLRLEERENGKLCGKVWHGYIYLKNLRRQNQPKVCVPRLVDRLCAALDADGTRFLDNVDVGGVTWKLGAETHDLRYLTALLNSTLLGWFFPFVSAPFRGNWMSANKQFLSLVPFRLIDFGFPDDSKLHNHLVRVVDKRLLAKKMALETKDGIKKEHWNRQSDALDRQIDALVYELYGLTEEEIALVENGA